MRNETRSGPSPVDAIAAAATIALLVACTAAVAAPQSVGIPTRDAPRISQASPEQESAAGVKLICEVYCSETNLRTATARLRWVLMPGPANDAMKAEGASAVEPRLEATVFRDGFAKNLYVRLPLAQSGDEAAVPSAEMVKQGKQTLRAYQLRVTDVERPGSAQALEAVSAETAAVVENLEPGMNYTWRLVVESAAGTTESPTVTCQAPVCPADMAREGAQEGPQ